MYSRSIVVQKRLHVVIDKLAQIESTFEFEYRTLETETRCFYRVFNLILNSECRPERGLPAALTNGIDTSTRWYLFQLLKGNRRDRRINKWSFMVLNEKKKKRPATWYIKWWTKPEINIFIFCNHKLEVNLSCIPFLLEIS